MQYSWFEFGVVLLQDKSYLLFTHKWKEWMEWSISQEH